MRLFNFSLNETYILFNYELKMDSSLSSNNKDSLMTMLSLVISSIASLAMIFGGIAPYIPQYRMINRSRNSTGFSTYVCLSLLIANILRILFWFGHPFEIPLLLQSIVMILTMLVMLELCIRIKNESGLMSISNKKFTDFNLQSFWKWSDFSSYVQFLLLFCAIGGLFVLIFIENHLFIETIGLLSVLTEAMLAAPQFYRNYINKSTEGMSISMVIMWTCGDIFKTSYFILRNSPVQFWICGILQVSIDVAVLFQVFKYSNNRIKS